MRQHDTGAELVRRLVGAVPLPVDDRVIAGIIGGLELFGRDVVGGEAVVLCDAVARLHLEWMVRSDGGRGFVRTS